MYETKQFCLQISQRSQHQDKSPKSGNQTNKTNKNKWYFIYSEEPIKMRAYVSQETTRSIIQWLNIFKTLFIYWN